MPLSDPSLPPPVGPQRTRLEVRDGQTPVGETLTWWGSEAGEEEEAGWLNADENEDEDDEDDEGDADDADYDGAARD